MFYIKIFLVGVWFFTLGIGVFFLCLLRWRDPNIPSLWANFFASVSEKILGVEFKLHHKERLKIGNPFVIVANHQDTLDICAHAKCVPPRCVGIGKRELLFIPLLGLLFYMTGNILIRRTNKEKAREALQEAMDYIYQQNVSIYMFPEGTRNHGRDELLPFKKGAFHLAIAAQVPIVPVVAEKFEKCVNFRRKTLTPGIINIEYLEPISTKGMNESHVDELIAKTRKVMQDAFNRLSGLS